MFFVFTSSYLMGQTVPKGDTSCSCSNIFKDEMYIYFWKKDSLANNGARFFSFSKLLTCRLDSIDSLFLVKSLGRPNKIYKYNTEVVYLYNFFNAKTLPKDIAIPLARWYIGFVFKYDGKGFIYRIYNGDTD
jgi:hypothetical protein